MLSKPCQKVVSSVNEANSTAFYLVDSNMRDLIMVKRRHLGTAVCLALTNQIQLSASSFLSSVLLLYILGWQKAE